MECFLVFATTGRLLSFFVTPLCWDIPFLSVGALIFRGGVLLFLRCDAQQPKTGYSITILYFFSLPRRFPFLPVSVSFAQGSLGAVFHVIYDLMSVLSVSLWTVGLACYIELGG